MTVEPSSGAERAAALHQRRQATATRLRGVQSCQPGAVNPALRQAFLAARAAAASTLAQDIAALDEELKRTGNAVELTDLEIDALPTWSAMLATRSRTPSPRAQGADDQARGARATVRRAPAGEQAAHFSPCVIGAT